MDNNPKKRHLSPNLSKSLAEDSSLDDTSNERSLTTTVCFDYKFVDTMVPFEKEADAPLPIPITNKPAMFEFYEKEDQNSKDFARFFSESAATPLLPTGYIMLPEPLSSQSNGPSYIV